MLFSVLVSMQCCVSDCFRSEGGGAGSGGLHSLGGSTSVRGRSTSELGGGIRGQGEGLGRMEHRLLVKTHALFLKKKSLKLRLEPLHPDEIFTRQSL